MQQEKCAGAVKEMTEMRRREEWENVGSKGGEGGCGDEVQKPTVMVPVQRERGGEGGRKRKREERS